MMWLGIVLYPLGTIMLWLVSILIAWVSVKYERAQVTLQEVVTVFFLGLIPVLNWVVFFTFAYILLDTYGKKIVVFGKK